MKVRFQADADLKHAIVSATLRREPTIDFRSAPSAHLAGRHDMDVLAIAAQEGRVLVSHDSRTMPGHFTVEELERTIPCLDEGLSFTEILEDYILSKPEPIFTYKDFLGDYLNRKGIKPRLNEWTDQRFREINDAIRDHFTVID